jgi:hypothetical protein
VAGGLLYHIPTQLGIGEFKRLVNEQFAGNSKSFRNRLIRAYKKRAWAEYGGVARGRGTSPTHSVRGKSIKVKRSPIFVDEIEVVHKKTGSGV